MTPIKPAPKGANDSGKDQVLRKPNPAQDAPDQKSPAQADKANPDKKAPAKEKPFELKLRPLTIEGYALIGAADIGSNGANPIAIGNFGALGDYTSFALGGSALWALGKWIRLGAGLRWNHFTGQVNANKGTINSLYAAGIAEANFSHLWKDKPFSIFPRAQLGVLLGGGWGEIPAETIRNFSQSGFAFGLGLAIDAISVKIAKDYEISAGVYLNTDWIKGSQFNTGFNQFGFRLSFRGSDYKVEHKQVCEDTKEDINFYIKGIAEHREKNAKVKEDLDHLRGLLEKGSNPITVRIIRDALFYREVRLALASQLPAQEKAIRKAIKKASNAKTPGGSDKALLAVKGVTPQMLSVAKAKAAKTYPENYNFWAQVTPNPDATTVPVPLPEDCDERHDLEVKLRDEYNKLRDRYRDLKGRFDTAILLDALKDKLGKPVTKIITVARAMVLDIVNPNFRVDFPKKGQVDALRSYVETLTAQGKRATKADLIPFINGSVRRNGRKSSRPSNRDRVFEVGKYDLNTADQVARMMLGEVIPSTNPDAKMDPKDEKEIKEAMKTVKLKIEGHTSEEGTDANNMDLSKRRAEFFTLMVRALGGPKNRLSWQGYGETRPLLAEKGLRGNARLTARIKNRRITVRIAGSTAPSAPTVEEHNANITPDRATTNRVLGGGDKAKAGGGKSGAPSNDLVAPPKK